MSRCCLLGINMNPISKQDELKYSASFLFTPAVDVSKFDRGVEVGVDVTVLDLEDSVSNDKKAFARENILNYFSVKPVFLTGLRINSIRCSDGIKDLQLLFDMQQLPDAIFISKVVAAEEIKIIKDLLLEKNQELPLLIAIIENVAGLNALDKIAQVADGLIFGSADFCADIEMEMSWKNLFSARQQIIEAAAENNILCIDTAFFHLDDRKGLFRECFKIKKMGLHAKAALNPMQAEIINKALAPRRREILHANKVVSESEKNLGGVNRMKDIMIGPPFLIMANKILIRAEIRRKHSNAA